ncbi:MAG: WYL domain-containing protein [bacterium]|nr:WYL domain-containing protein [bacterium]MCP4968499.1 WYL domain-containing protein [bacterium]
MHKVIERILNLLAFLLTTGKPVTADEIRTTVAGYDQATDDAFHRMFERDKDLLRRLGIPLELAPTDGWQVEHGYVVDPDTYALPDPGLTDDERAALWLAAEVVRLGGQVAAPDALFKLGGAPMTASGEPLAASLTEGSDDLGTAFLAVVERRQLLFDYREKARRVDPYGLVHRRGHWYLVGAEGETTKVFRMDKATRVDVGDDVDAFDRPTGFRAADFIPETPWEAGADEMVAKVRFGPTMAWWARRQIGNRGSLHEDSDGGIEAMIPVANPEAFIGWLLSFDDNAELLEPPELRQRLVDRVAEGR